MPPSLWKLDKEKKDGHRFPQHNIIQNSASRMDEIIHQQISFVLNVGKFRIRRRHRRNFLRWRQFNSYQDVYHNTVKKTLIITYIYLNIYLYVMHVKENIELLMEGWLDVLAILSSDLHLFAYQKWNIFQVSLSMSLWRYVCTSRTVL